MITRPVLTLGLADDDVSRRTVLRGALGGTLAALVAAGWQVSAGHAQEATPQPVEPTAAALPEGPVRLVILFGAPTDPEAFQSYYRQMHLPLAAQMPGILRFETGRALRGLEGEPPVFSQIVTMDFASLADLEASVASPEGQAAFADVANFATAGLTATIVTDIETFIDQGETTTP
jgi:uncharacterized protein (TIGR02118 family)